MCAALLPYRDGTQKKITIFLNNYKYYRDNQKAISIDSYLITITETRIISVHYNDTKIFSFEIRVRHNFEQCRSLIRTRKILHLKNVHLYGIFTSCSSLLHRKWLNY